MRNKLIAVLMLSALLLTTVQIILQVQPVSAMPTGGPSLVVDDTINRCNATLGVKAGSKVTAKGVITNIGITTLTNLLTGVYFIEGTGGCVPADFSFEFSLDCVTWFPIDPSEIKIPSPAAAPMQVELVIGSFGGETLNPGDSSSMYLRMTFNNDLTTISWPTNIIQSMIVWVFRDTNLNRHFDSGEPIYSQPPAYGGVIGWDNPIKIDLAVMHTAEIEGTGKFYYTIQGAIDAASPGQTIYVYDGTYDEQVVISKSLTVQGTGSTPVIKPSSAAQLTTILSGHYEGGTKQIAGIIVANVADGSSVTVKNLIVDGENVITKPTGADYVTGIFYRETGGLIDTVTIANMTIDATGTSVRAYGIYLSAIVNTVSVEIKGCNISNYDKNGINAHGYKLTVNIHDNTITGRGPLPSGDEVQNGILIMDSATGTVNRNTISNLIYIPETWWSAGILFLDSGGSAEGNTITNCQIGIIFQDGNGSAQDNTVTGGKIGIHAQYTKEGTWTASFVNNTVSNSDTWGIGAATYHAGASLTITMDDNQLTGASADGIYIGDIPDYGPAGSITAIIRNNDISNWRLGIHLVSSVAGATITGNTIIDFTKGGIVTRGAKNIFIEGNTISTTLHDEAPNGIDIGTYTGTTGTVKGNEISGCSWKDFTGYYETSWSGSGILVIESGDSLEIIGNIVHECDVGMDIESDSMNITCNDVHDNIYGFVFWNAKPKVNYNNIYSNTQYGVYRTTSGDLTGTLDARYNWWGDPSGPGGVGPGTGDAVSDYVNFSPWLLTEKVPPLVHDVAIIDIVPSATRIIVGTTIQINVIVKNEGTAYENFTVTLSYDANIIGTKTITDLTPGATKLLTFNWDTTGVTPYGDYTIKAQASTVPGETDLADNVKTVKVRLGMPPTIKVEPPINNAQMLNKTFNINITMNDLGDYWKTIAVQFRLCYNDTLLEVVNVTEGPFMQDPRWNLEGTFFIYFVETDYVYGPHVLVGILLLPNDTGYWNAFPYGSGVLATVTFKAIYQERGLEKPPLTCSLTLEDTMIIPDEGDEIPHILQHGQYKMYPTHIGDFDYNGKVDMKDIRRAAKAFASYPGHERWDPICEITGDDKIDMKDIRIVAKGFGWTPTYDP